MMVVCAKLWQDYARITTKLEPCRTISGRGRQGRTADIKAPGQSTMTLITRTDLNFERERLRAPWGFKGGFLTECWQTMAKVESSSGQSAVGLGVQSVLWSDPAVFVGCSEAAGNATMLLLTSAALDEIRRTKFDTPLDLLDNLIAAVHRRGKEITGNPELRLTFVLNALVAVDCALWRLAAAEKNAGFNDLIPDFARAALSHRHERIVCVPAIGYGMAVKDIESLVEEGFFVLKIKIGSDPNRDGDPAAMLSWDCARLTEIHRAVGEIRPANSPTGRVLYYLDANGRYDGLDRINRLLEHLAAIDALDRTILLEEPFPEHVRADVGDLPVRIVADESAHTERDVIDRIDLGYGAIALKPAAKTLSMSFRMAKAAFDRGVPCFCADLTVNPALVDWNKLFAAHLLPLPELGMMLLEANGFQNYRDWDRMVTQHSVPNADWIAPREGVFHLSDAFHEQSGGMFAPLPHYEALTTPPRLP